MLPTLAPNCCQLINISISPKLFMCLIFHCQFLNYFRDLAIFYPNVFSFCSVRQFFWFPSFFCFPAISPFFGCNFLSSQSFSCIFLVLPLSASFFFNLIFPFFLSFFWLFNLTCFLPIFPPFLDFARFFSGNLG